MYFLSKFCRICIQSDVKLLDLDTLDFDEVKLSKKLEVCTKMVVTRESFPSEICMQCITKLRISYQFYNMCKKSNITLQKYLKNLICDKENKIISDKFVNTELNVLVTPLRGFEELPLNRNTETDLSSNHAIDHKEKRKRITKEQRCSLLKKLLTPSEIETDRDKCFDQQYYEVQSADNFKGLTNIISFTQNYEFGRSLDKNSNYSTSPLDKLKAFSNEFFKRDFSDFKNTILYIIENEDTCDSDVSEQDGFNTPEEKEDPDDYVFKFEEVIVEPDVKIKTEIEFEDEDSFSYCGYTDSLDSKTNTIKCEPSESMLDFYCSDYTDPITHVNGDSMQLLNNFVGTYSHRRTFSPNNVRCRTRDNPYINPRLKEQFLHRSFKCEKCSRFFKSPGYLKAHFSKVHSSLLSYP